MNVPVLDTITKTVAKWLHSTLGSLHVLIQGIDSVTGLPSSQTITGGAANVTLKSQDEYSSDRNITFKATAVTATAVLTTSDLTAYHRGLLTISGLTSETIAMTRTVDSVTGLATPVIDADGTASTVPELAATLGSGTFVIENLMAEILTFVKSSTSEAVTITLSLFP